MKKIPLTQGKYALVDDENFEELNKYKWCTYKHGNTFYATRGFLENGKSVSIKMHRLILKARKGETCDHINGNGLDNRRSNLRLCTQAENVRNTRKRHDNTSGYKGVVWHKYNKKFTARISIEKKRIELGSFDTAREAALAYNKAAKKHHGKFARLNSIQL